MSDAISPVADLTARLAAMRGAVRRLYLLDGLSRVALIAVAAAAGTFVLDWSIPDLPAGVRLALLGIALAVVGWAVARYVIYPLRRPLTDDDLALCVERVFPGLEDRLISALQLVRTAQDPAWRSFNSPVLVDALVAEARDATAAVEFRRVLIPRPVVRVAACAALVALGAAAAAWANPEYASIWFHRLLGGAVKWPRQTDLALVEPARFVAKGDDYTVTVRATRKIPARVTIQYEFKGGERGAARMQALPVTRGPAGEYGDFKYEFLRVVEDFGFSVRGGDDETLPFDVEVRTAPALERLEAWFDYPDYLGLPDTPKEKPEPGGNIKAPVGTVAHLRALSGEPLAGARLVFASRPDKPEPLAVEHDAEGRPRALSGKIAVRANDEYRIELTGVNQLSNREPIRYAILAVPDAAPVLRVVEPGADRVATLDAEWPLEIATTDDYGLKAVRLVWWLEGPAAAQEHAVDYAYPAQNSAVYGARRIESRHAFALAATGAKDRDRIAYRFEAWDFDGAKTKPAQTRTFHFTIWSKSDLEKRLEEDLNRVKEQLREALGHQESIRKNTARLRDLTAGLEALEAGLRQELGRTALDQRQKVGQRLERAVKDLQEAVKTVKFNRLLDQAALEKLERLEALVDGAAQQKSPAAGHEVTEASGARSPAERRERFDRGLGQMDGIIADLQDALALLEDWMTYQEVVRRWREVRDLQDAVNKAILDLLDKPGPGRR